MHPLHPNQYGAQYAAPFGPPGAAYHPVAHRAGIGAPCVVKPSHGHLNRVTADVIGSDGWFRLHDCAAIEEADVGNLILQISFSDAAGEPNRSVCLQFHTGLVVSSVTEGGILSLGFSV